MTRKKITAKFPGTCPACGQYINPGDLIWWAKGQRAEHVECPTGSSSESNRTAPKRTRSRTPHRPGQPCATCGWWVDPEDTAEGTPNRHATCKDVSNEILNGPVGAVYTRSRREIGEAILVPQTQAQRKSGEAPRAAIVAARRWISRDDAEDFDLFDFADTGCWILYPARPRTDVECAACAKLVEAAMARREAEAKRVRQEAEEKAAKRAVAEQRKAEAEALIEQGWVNSGDIVWGVWPINPEKRGYYLDGRSVTIYRGVDLAGRPFVVQTSYGYDDDRVSIWGPKEVVVDYLHAHLAARPITEDDARTWLDGDGNGTRGYRGCVGTELHQIAVGETPTWRVWGE